MSIIVGNRLRMLREAKGFTKKQVAEGLEIPYTTYVNYEKDVCQPNNEVLVKLALFYQISVDWLLDYTPKSESPPPDEKWEALRKILELLSDDELKEVHSFVKFQLWKHRQEEQG